MVAQVNRRGLMAGIGALSLVPHLARADAYIDLDWKDLMPEGQTALPQVLSGLLGFILPIDYSGTGVTAFILVPYVGACVHVPPPPANQLVFVTTPEPYETKGLFEAVNVVKCLCLRICR